MILHTVIQVLGRSPSHRELFVSCYSEDVLALHGHKVIISSGTILGTRNGVLLWSRAMTQQLQDAPGRVVESRCKSAGIDQSFALFLVYTSKLRQALRIKIYPQGEGPVNCLGGNMISKDSIQTTASRLITGSLKSFWKLLDDDNYVVNWSGERSPVVHQINHFIDELEALVAKNSSIQVKDRTDIAWQSLAASRCLWGSCGFV